MRSIKERNGQVLIQFLDQLLVDRELTHLMLVGDIFDLWVGPGEVFFHQYYPVVDRCLRLKDRGVEIHYFEGNHDFHLKGLFQNELGIVVHTQAQNFGSERVRIRVEHGDQMDPNDKGYLFLRWLWRTPVVTWLAHQLPSWWISMLGERLSRESRRYTSQVKVVDEVRARNIVREHAQKCAESIKFDILVSGHFHVVDDFQFQSQGRQVRSLNLGTWLTQPRALEVQLNNHGYHARWLDVVR